MRWIKLVVKVTLLLVLGPLAAVAFGGVNMAADWRTASRDSAGIAPDPASHREALVQVYAARAFSWRGAFAVHTWIAFKPEDAPRYTVAQVVGWRYYHGGSALVVGEAVPDRRWFGAAPELVTELRGAAAAAAIPEIRKAIASYPYPDFYRMWPGPNSNTLTAYVARRVPALRLSLPVTAIGKDWIEGGGVFSRAPSGTGYQVSLFGLLGGIVAVEEGLEINLLSLGFGIDPTGPALKLPGLGRLGFGRG